MILSGLLPHYIPMMASFGMPVAVAATFVVMFVVFGAFLGENRGWRLLFLQLAKSLAGKQRGGPARLQ